MEYGLIGAKLGHSYSKIIHEAVCGYSYELHPLPTEEEAHAFMQAKAFKAINVTIPYKKLVIPYCDEVEPRAAAIGAVNTVVNRDGKLYGYNTDYTGFAYLARCHGVKFAGAGVLPGPGLARSSPGIPCRRSCGFRGATGKTATKKPSQNRSALPSLFLEGHASRLC